MWTIEEILHVTGAELVQGNLTGAVQRIQIDSRNVATGDLFLALPGSHLDGHKFVESAVTHGAVAVLVDQDVRVPPSATHLRVHDTRQALVLLARHVRKKLRKVIAITGSAGKTTTKDLLGHLLRPHFAVGISPGNLNSTTGVPLSLINEAQPSQEIWIQEVGINRPGEMDWIASMLRPDIAVILNAYPTHLEGLRDMETIIREKSALVLNSDIAICRSDIPGLREGVQQNLKKDSILWTFGSYDPSADVNMKKTTLHKNGMKFWLEIPSRIKDPLECSTRHHLPWLPSSTSACAAVFLALDIDPSPIPSHLNSFEPPPHRGQFYRLPGPTVIFDDTYNANPVAVQMVLEFYRHFPRSRRCLVFGDMLELGPDSEFYHRQLAPSVHDASLEVLVTVGRLANVLREELDRHQWTPKLSYPCKDSSEASHLVPALVQTGDVWILKGSRGMALDEVVQAILKARIHPETHHAY